MLVVMDLGSIFHERRFDLNDGRLKTLNAENNAQGGIIDGISAALGQEITIEVAYRAEQLPQLQPDILAHPGGSPNCRGLNPGWASRHPDQLRVPTRF